jgi:UDP-glucose 4-epimerase
VILVTGGSSFIGSALAQRLCAEGADIRGLVRSRPSSAASEFVRADLAAGPLDPALLDGIGTIYHLAAKTHDLHETAGAEAEYSRINIDGTRNLLNAAEGCPIRRFVFVSSVKALDEGGPEMRDETWTSRPTSAYGRSKLAAEKLIFDTATARGFETCLRFPLVYGPGQRGNLTRMMAAIDRGHFPPPPGNGNRRSMLHVENAVDALMLAGRHPAAAGQTYLVTDAEPYSTRQVYDWIREALGKPAHRRSVPVWFFRMLAASGDAARAFTGRRAGFDSDAFQKLLGSAWYSSKKIIEELGFVPRRDLRRALPELVTAYRRSSQRKDP